jgi:hypothetical protein
MKRIVLLISVLATVAVVAIVGRTGHASDHDDGDNPDKERALNLTDHFAFRSPRDASQLSLVMYFNPRSLPGKQHFLATNARYEFHVSKIATRTTPPTAKDDFVFRFEAGEPGATGVQPVTLTVLKDGAVLGTHSGMTTNIAASQSGAITTNEGSAGDMPVKYFVGPRADSFHFDVIRFFQVRAYLADRLFGGGGGTGNYTAELADNCRGDKFLAKLRTGGAAANEANGVPDEDVINLFNPPSCAPDFTKNLNVTAIVLNVPIAQLGGTIFDTWSTISVAQ